MENISKEKAKEEYLKGLTTWKEVFPDRNEPTLTEKISVYFSPFILDPVKEENLTDRYLILVNRFNPEIEITDALYSLLMSSKRIKNNAKLADVLDEYIKSKYDTSSVFYTEEAYADIKNKAKELVNNHENAQALRDLITITNKR